MACQPSTIVIEAEQRLDLTAAPEATEDEETEAFPSLFVGPALRAMRIRANVSQGDIARHLGIDSSIPSRWEGFDAIHNGQTTRYKPVPGKYFSPLASFLRCSLGDLAPELEPPHTNGTAASAVNQQTTSALNGHTLSLGTATVSSYTLGGGVGYVPRPVTGRPPEELVKQGQWRRICRGCKKVFLESLEVRAPSACDVCQTPIRPSVTVSVNSS